MRNVNHPPKGSITRTDPLRTAADRNRVESLLELEGRLRDLGIFTVGCNTNLRASDLVRITVGDMRGRRPGDTVTLRERKTGKVRTVAFNAKVCAVLERWLAVKIMGFLGGKGCRQQ